MFSQASVILSTGRGRAWWGVYVAERHCSFLSDRVWEKKITEINPNKISGEKHYEATNQMFYYPDRQL